MVRQINVAILVVDEEVCGDEWAGVVRREDVRATEKEKLVIGESFRVGDLIRGEVVCNLPGLDERCAGAAIGFLLASQHTGKGSQVIGKIASLNFEKQISLGDQTNYYLTTARNELGVIMAKSEAGNTMFPISWKDFKDPVTGETETRKVAKPI